MNTYSGYLKIEDIDYSFFINGTELFLLPLSQGDTTMEPYNIYEYKCLYGQLTNYHHVCLLDVKIITSLFGGIRASVSAIIVGTRNVGDDISIEPINSVRFKGEIINKFYSHLRRIDREKTFIRNDGNASISIKPFLEAVKEHDIESETGNKQLLFSVEYYQQSSIKDEVIALINSAVDLILTNPIKCDQVQDVYIQVLNFFRFINFRMNIEFDEVLLRKKTSHGQYQVVAKLIFLSTTEKTKTENRIIYEDFCNNLSKLFEVLCKSDRYTLFIPKNDREAKYVNYLSYLNTSACFEYFYFKSYHKEMNEEMSLKFKQQISDKVSEIQCEFMNEFMDYIQEFDPNKKTLKNKFKEVLSSKKDIIKEVYPKLKLNSDGIDTLSYEFSKQRNKIAHGDTDDLMGIKINPYVITLCLLYALILEESGLSKESIVNILRKLFGQYYSDK